MSSRTVSRNNQLTSRAFTALALAVLLLIAFTQYASNGVVRGGGDDEGSGIGGTGRVPVPAGGSGIGGTGLKPYLGLNADNEIEILRDPAGHGRAITHVRPIPENRPTLILPLVPPQTQVTRPIDRTFDSAPIDISEAIQNELDINVVTLSELRYELIAQAAHDSFVGSVEATVERQIPSGRPNWSDVARLLGDSSVSAASDQVALESSNMGHAADNLEDPARLSRPERIQRPQLPPLQRVSPLQRTAILPPRVQPLRL